MNKPAKTLPHLNNTYQYGLDAESIAANYFRLKGYIALKHRYKTPHGEIDLIVNQEKEKQLIFVEVKARKRYTSLTHDNLEQLITEKQKKRCIDAANYFMAENKVYLDYLARFDLLFINNNVISLHVSNAWLE